MLPNNVAQQLFYPQSRSWVSFNAFIFHLNFNIGIYTPIQILTLNVFLFDYYIDPLLTYGS